MKHKHLAATATIIIVLFTTCKKDKDIVNGGTPMIVALTYPLVVGNEWTYYRELHFVDDSTFTDTLLYQGYCFMRNDRIETLPDNSIAYAFEFSDSSSSGAGLTGTQFYNNTSTGLYHHGYISNSSGAIYLMPEPLYRFRIGNMESNSLRELINMIIYGNPDRVDSIIVNNPHKLSLKYPLVLNDEWTYTTTPWLLNRKYVGDETVSTPFGNFLCKKIEWMYDTDNDSVWDDLHIWQYISPTKGLLKYTLNTEVILSNINGDTLGIGTATDESIAISVNF